MDPELGQNLEAALRRARNADGSVSRDGELSRNHEVRLRSMPEVMKLLGEPDVPLVMTVHHIRKVVNGHKLSASQFAEVVKGLDDPVMTVKELDGSYLFLLDVKALNREGALAPIVGVVRKKENREDVRYAVSFYPLEENKEAKFAQQYSRLVYCRQSKTAKFAADAPKSNKASELLRAAIGGGFTDNIPTREDVVKRKNDIEMQAARRATGSSGALLAELAMREYLRPLAAALRDAKKSGESYAAIKKRLATPLTAAATLAHGLAAAFNTGRALPQGDVAAAATLAEHCNQYQHIPGCPHEGGSPHPTTHQAPSDTEPWEERQEERERLEALLTELDRQEEAARDAESSGDPRFYNEEEARDRWNTLTHDGDPQTREDIEKRLAELDAQDSMADAGIPENRINQIFASDAGVNTDAGFNHPSIGNTGNWESLGLGSAKDFTHDTPLPSDKKEAGIYNSALEHGFEVKSVEGKPVTFDKAILEHWDEEGKTSADKEGRLKHLPDAIRTIRAPHEVWELANGQRAYIRAFSETIQGGKGEPKTKNSYISSFVVGEDGKVRSYVYTKNPGTANSARKGTLQYKR